MKKQLGHGRNYSSLFLLLLLVMPCTSQEEEEKQLRMEANAKRSPIIEAVKSMFSFPNSLPLTSARWSWSILIQQAKAYFFPPTVDFRNSQDAQTRAQGGEKVKEAVLKSIDKGKATMEDSAKSAAKLAGDAVQKTKNKVKRTFSFGDKDQQPDEEL